VRRLPAELRCRTSRLDLRRGVPAYARDTASVLLTMLRTRPGCVHLQYTPTTSGPLLPVILWAARYAIGAHVVITAHERPSTYERKLPAPAAIAFRAWEAMALKAASRVIVLSKTHQQELRSRYRIDSQFVHHGVDAGGADATIVVDRSHGRVPCITFAGFVRPAKGVEDLVRAAPLIGERMGASRVSIVGATAERDRAYAAELRRLINDAQRDGSCTVEMTGAVSDGEFRQRLAAADVFVFPFRAVSQSNTFNRAVAAGIPVVAADAGGVGDVVHEHGVGLTYRGGDVRALADAVCRLLQDRELYAACRERARKYAAASDWRVIARQHVELYGSREAA